MNDVLQKIWKPLVGLLIGIFIGLAINLPSCNKQDPPKTIKVPVHDTVTIDSIQIKWKEKPVEVLRIDTFYTTKDGDTIKTPEIPIIKKVYEDTISTDSTSTEIKIQYSGFNASINGIELRHNYFNKTQIIPEKKKLISPFIFVEGGPSFNQTFKQIDGAEVGIGAGIYIKDSWGLGASYNLDVKKELNHTVKLQLYKKF